MFVLLRVREARPDQLVTLLLLVTRSNHVELVQALGDAGEAGDQLTPGEH